MNTLARFAALLFGTLIPTFARAATSVVGGITSSGGGFLGLSWGSGSFGSIGVGCNYNSICVLAQQALFIINYVLVPLLFGVAFIVFLYGVFKAYILSGGSEEAVSKGHQLVLWGVLGFVIMISLWGLVNVVANTLMLSGVSAPPPPSSLPY